MHSIPSHVRVASVAAAIVSLQAAAGVPACFSDAIDLLKKVDPDGFKVSQLVSPDSFGFWLNCEDPTYGLPAAVHESTHSIATAQSKPQTTRLYLLDGNYLAIPELELFPCHEIVPQIGPNECNMYCKTYPRDPKWSVQSFERLLDELNAYTHSLRASIRFESERPTNRLKSARDGLISMMYFVELYLRQAKRAHPEAWTAMANSSDLGKGLKRLWSDAETTFLQACSNPRLGINDGPFVKKVYEPGNLKLIQELMSANKIDIQFKSPGNCGSFEPERQTDADVKVTTRMRTTHRREITINDNVVRIESTEQLENGVEIAPKEVHRYFNNRELATLDEFEQIIQVHPEFKKDL